MRLRRTITSIIVLAGTVAAGTACASTQKTAAGNPAAPAAATSGTTASSPTTSGSTSGSTSDTGPGTSTTGSAISGSIGVTHAPAPAPAPANNPAKTGKITSGDPLATSDSYAWSHPCDASQVKIKIGPAPSGAADLRIIMVTNTGTKSCGLDYFPAVLIADGNSVGAGGYPTKFLKPTPPQGIGGAPTIPVYAGRSLYAAVSLNPTHAATGASTAYDELDVQANEAMPHAATVNYSLKSPTGANPLVFKPVVSLYYPTAADAVRLLPKG